MMNIEANYDEVICPNCVTQFRAIPVNVQDKLRKQADAIERLENEAVAATLRIDNDKLVIDGLRAELEKIKSQEPVALPRSSYCTESTGESLYTETQVHQLLAAGAQPVPEGMVLVPIDLTDAMLEKLAYMGRSRVVSGPNKSDWEPAAIRHWKAMLEAVKP